MGVPGHMASGVFAATAVGLAQEPGRSPAVVAICSGVAASHSLVLQNAVKMFLVADGLFQDGRPAMPIVIRKDGVCSVRQETIQTAQLKTHQQKYALVFSAYA